MEDGLNHRAGDDAARASGHPGNGAPDATQLLIDRLRWIREQPVISLKLAQEVCDALPTLIMLLDALPDGRVRLVQEHSLQRSQLANCIKEIINLRAELLRYSGPLD